MQSRLLALRGAQRSHAVVILNAVRCSMSTNISGGSLGKAWADKEHAAENQYFSKQEAENLAKLAKKLQKLTEPNEEVIGKAREEVTALFAKYSVTAPDALVDDILKFKFNKE